MGDEPEQALANKQTAMIARLFGTSGVRIICPPPLWSESARPITNRCAFSNLIQRSQSNLEVVIRICGITRIFNYPYW
jgi:hypothetical protein